MKKMAFTINTPNITGNLVTLSPFSEEFLTLEYVNWLNDPEVVKFSEQRHKTHTLESCQEYYKSMLSNGHFFWAILCNQSSKKHIGNLTAYIDKNNLIADLAIMIGDLNFQGMGLGQDAWTLACDYLLNSKQVRKVTAGTMAINKSMLKIMHNSGMKQEGIRSHYFLVNGNPVDLVFAAKQSDYFIS